MRAMWVAALGAMVGCAGDSAAVAEADPAWLADGFYQPPPLTTNTVAIDCSKAPAKYSQRCAGGRGGEFGSTASGSPNVIPNDWMPLSLKAAEVVYTADERGGLQFSLDGGKTVVAIADGVAGMDSIELVEVADPDAAGMVSIQLRAYDREGTLFALGEIAVLGADGESIGGKGFDGGKTFIAR